MVFEAQAEHAAGDYQPNSWLAVQPAADGVDPVDDAEEFEHDEVDEALLADDPEDVVLPEEVEPPAEVEAPAEIEAPRHRGGDGRR